MIENVAKVLEAFLEDWKQIIHDVCSIVGLLYGMCQWILSYELSVWCIASEFVLMLRSND
jgi:hypothetical protein